MNNISRNKINEFRPLLTFKGLVFLSAICLGPLAGILAEISFTAAVVISSVIFTILVVAFILAELKMYLFSKSFSCFASLSRQSAVVTTTPFRLVITHPQLQTAHKLELRLQPHTGTKFEDEIINTSILPKRTSTALETSLHITGRGIFSWDCVWVRLYSRFGLCALQFRLPFASKVTTDVYPNPELYSLQIDNRSKVRLPGLFKNDHAGGEGKEFDRLRKYSSGDDLRRVDWKRSSNKGTLLVKVYRPETLQRISVMLDCSRRMNNVVAGRLQLDYAVDATASLLNTATANGDRFGLLTFDHRKLNQFASAHGHAHRKIIFECLRDVTPGTLEADYDLIGAWAQETKRRSLLVLITSLSTPTGVEQIRRALLPIRRKHLPLVVAIHDRDLIQLLDAPASSLATAYRIAAGAQQMQEIKSRIAILKQSGIECVYGDATMLPAMAIRKYYELKAMGKL